MIYRLKVYQGRKIILNQGVIRSCLGYQNSLKFALGPLLMGWLYLSNYSIKKHSQIPSWRGGFFEFSFFSGFWWISFYCFLLVGMAWGIPWFWSLWSFYLCFFCVFVLGNCYQGMYYWSFSGIGRISVPVGMSCLSAGVGINDLLYLHICLRNGRINGVMAMVFK